MYLSLIYLNKMKISLIIMGISLLCHSMYAQTDKGDEDQILDLILLTAVSKDCYYSDTIFVETEKFKPFFDSDVFSEQTALIGLDTTMLAEISNNTKHYLKNEKWDISSFNNVGSFAKIRFLDKDEFKAKNLNTKNRKNLFITISMPLFNTKRDHCVVTIIFSQWKNSFYAHSIFAKKVYGKWVILLEFDFVLS